MERAAARARRGELTVNGTVEPVAEIVVGRLVQSLEEFISGFDRFQL